MAGTQMVFSNMRLWYTRDSGSFLNVFWWFAAGKNRNGLLALLVCILICAVLLYHPCLCFYNFISSAVTSLVGRYFCGWSEDNRKSKCLCRSWPNATRESMFHQFWIVEELEVIQCYLCHRWLSIRSSWARKIPVLQVGVWCLVRYDRSTVTTSPQNAVLEKLLYMLDFR